jgi:hypothetical protein
MIATAAMARDNGFGVVVLIAGTSELLLTQSRRRFEASLGLDGSDQYAYRRWRHFQSPTPRSENAVRVEEELTEWLRADGDQDRASILISVMKHHTHLAHLADVLETIGERIDLTRVPALVFDDEADQASPNLRRAGLESPTYRDLGRVRRALPWHTLLQYTATPQALLLISIADSISPEFTCVLAPGDGYVGGKYFFEEHATDFVRVISDDDVAAVASEEPDPPESLLHALAVFALGAAAGRLVPNLGGPQRSMLIHPSHQTLPHARYANWIRQSKDLWAETLELSEEDPDRSDLIETRFLPAHHDLELSCPTLPPLPDLISEAASVLRRLNVQQVNSAAEARSVPWQTGYGWVLVGGQLLDRGFTVEGLTVTYMPRGMGQGNADTLQQRARFFGYKRPYAELCRSWLEPDLARSFGQYVEHEESIRSQLVDQTAQGGTLRDWTRAFLLNRDLQPTRRNVIRLEMERATFGDEWVKQRRLVALQPNANAANAEVLEQFVREMSFGDLEAGRGWTEAQKPLWGRTSVRHSFQSLLSQFAMYDDDAPQFTALQLLLGEGLDRIGDEDCAVYQMNGGLSRDRTIRADDSTVELHQGANPGTGYPGDREIKIADLVSIQIHRVKVQGRREEVLEESAPALAIWIPLRIARDYLVQR